MKVLFLRHGQAEHNVAFQTEGPRAYKNPRYQDSALTEVGEFQASAIAKTLSEFPIDCIFTSPLTRCIQTALQVQAFFPRAPMFAVDALIEEQGDEEICNVRKPLEDLQEQFPSIDFDTFCSPEFTLWDWTDEREPQEAVKQRVQDFLKQIRPMNLSTVLCVSHHDTIRDTFGRELGNCEYISVENPK